MINRVLVAMSGGVDSSTTAALLLKQGYEVEGVTMKLTAGLCCDLASAQAVCRLLGIPHRVIDAQAGFDKSVIGNFIAEYRRGRTPNPCIRCNEIIKFTTLLSYAISNGFDLLATGHYARVEHNPASGRYLLRKGIDPDKDQSYFLYRLTQDQMRHLLFPLGGYRKTDVRKLASEMKLPAADRPESQEICFVPDNNYRAFLKEHAPGTLQPGELVLTDGTVVGRHEGVAFFTVGQRRNLGVAAGERLYVIRIEPDRNRVVLGRPDELETMEMLLSHPTFIPFDTLTSPLEVDVRIRYRSKAIPAVIEPAGSDRVLVRFRSPAAGVSPGQAGVLYQGDTVIGGGIIEG
ncbi:MAG TPA: tRNA 2-thiouridine(34) synthase MnmA [Nitrospirota bacterium]|nr:tRNA 2-thiouridine(34) synthase MnmA [Nitrospirota bacterium]